MKGFEFKQNRKSKNLRFKNRRNRFSQQLRCRCNDNDNQPKGDLLNSKFKRFENSEQKTDDEDK